MNQFAVPSCWVPCAVLWLMEGFGGESHVRSFSRDWFPVNLIQPSTIVVSGSNERCSSSIAVLENEKIGKLQRD